MCEVRSLQREWNMCCCCWEGEVVARLFEGAGKCSRRPAWLLCLPLIGLSNCNMVSKPYIYSISNVLTPDALAGYELLNELHLHVYHRVCGKLYFSATRWCAFGRDGDGFSIYMGAVSFPDHRVCVEHTRIYIIKISNKISCDLVYSFACALLT